MARNKEISMDEALKDSIIIQEELSTEELFRKIKGAKARAAESRSSKPKLQKVPDILRNLSCQGEFLQKATFEKYYEPRAVALGPFHHGKESCQLAEKFKLELTEKFVEDSGCTAEDLHKIIEDNITTLRDSYAEEATKSYTEKALTQLLFLDGCSTLQFISSYQKGELREFNIKRDQVASALQDLFLLENQLPYQVLDLLMGKSKKKDDLEMQIHEFIQGNIMAATNNGKRKKHTKVSQKKTEVHLISMNGSSQQNQPTHLLDLLRTDMLGPNTKQDPNCLYRQQSFRNIQELNAAGIKIKSTKTSTLYQVDFKPLFLAGTLYLPPISVDDSMRPKFLNLIAYEMCPDFENDFGVSSYICFLDSLIDHPDDVKELRKAKVLQNLLGSDKEVACLFNEIGTDLVLNESIYCKVKQDIDDHCSNKGKTWMAEFYHRHFSSPLTFLAFLGALVALGLGITQTYYAINPPSSPCDAVCEYLKKQLHIK